MNEMVVPVKNIARLTKASDALLTRTPGTPGMGLIYGRSGLGKTTATAWFVNQCNGVYVRALSTWSASSMLRSILKELDMEAKKARCADMVEQIVEHLKLTGRPLFLDEFDYIAENKRMTETLRDMHDISSVPIILVGMHEVKRKIQIREQFINRIAQWVEFQPADFADTRKLCDCLCEVKVEDDLLMKLYHQAGGVIRLLVIGLSQIERIAQAKNLESIELKDWGTEDFFFSDSPNQKRTFGSY